MQVSGPFFSSIATSARPSRATIVDAVHRIGARHVHRWGGAPLPAFGLVHVLPGCLMGSLVMLWSFMRLGEPSLALGRYEGIGRFLFALWMGWALLEGSLPLVWLFFVPELMCGVAHWLPVTPAVRPERRSRASLTLAGS